MTDLSQNENQVLKEQIMGMLCKHKNSQNMSLGTIKTTLDTINLKEGMPPISQHNYSAERQNLEVLWAYRQAVSGWCSSASSLQMGDSHCTGPKEWYFFRNCINYWRLDTVTIPDTYLFPRMNSCVDSLGKGKVFTALHALWGCW